MLQISRLLYRSNLFPTRNVKQSKDLGKSIPWPTAPRSIHWLSEMLRKAFLRWRAFTILSQYPKEEWPEMHRKITAMEILKGKRTGWGLSRRWLGDYLSETSENPSGMVAYRAMLRKCGVQGDTANAVLFSALTVKYNRHNKSNDRAVVITKDNRILKMDPSKKFKVMQTFQLSDVTGLGLSPDDGNRLVVLRLRTSSDLVLSLKSASGADLTGELVGVLASHFAKMMGRDLDIRVSNELEVKAGGTSKFLKVCHEAPTGVAGPGVEAVVDAGGFLRNNKDKGKVIVFTAPGGGRGTNGAMNGRG